MSRNWVSRLAIAAVLSVAIAPGAFGQNETPLTGAADDEDQIDVGAAGKQAPSLLAKTSTGVPLGVRLLLRQPVPEASNFFTESVFGTYVDDVYIGRPYGALYDFIDLDRIDVAPSAQSAGPGRNTADGAIRIYTKKPGDQFSWVSDLSLGSYDWIDARTAVSGPIVPNQIAASFSFLYRHRDGLVDDGFLHETVNDRNYQAARTRFLITPSDAWTIDVALDGVHDRSSPKFPSAVASATKTADPSAVVGRDIFDTEAVTPDFNEFDQGGVSVNNRYRFDRWTLTSISSVREMRSASYVSYDATPANTLSTEAFVRRWEYLEDVNLARASDKTEETLGLFYFHRDTNQFTPTGSAPNVSAEADNSYAAYANFRQAITDAFHVLAGIRYTAEAKDLFSDFYAGNKRATRLGVAKPVPPGLVPSQSIDEDWDGLAPRLSLEDQISPHWLAYFDYQRGFKSGGWNNRLPPDYNASGILVAKPLSYPGQTSNQYEIGVRATLVEDVLFIHAAAYRNDYRDLQIPVLVANASTYYLTSAPSASIDGLEWGATWNAARGLEIYSLASFQHGQYGPGFSCQNTAALFVNCSDNRLVGLAPLRAMIGFSYAPELPIPGQLRLSASTNYSDRYQNSVANVYPASTASHNLIDASIGYDFPQSHWSVSLEGRNLTNLHWFSAAAQSGPSVAVYPDDPRTFIVRLRYRY